MFYFLFSSFIGETLHHPICISCFCLFKIYQHYNFIFCYFSSFHWGNSPRGNGWNGNGKAQFIYVWMEKKNRNNNKKRNDERSNEELFVTLKSQASFPYKIDHCHCFSCHIRRRIFDILGVYLGICDYLCFRPFGNSIIFISNGTKDAANGNDCQIIMFMAHLHGFETDSQHFMNCRWVDMIHIIIRIIEIMESILKTISGDNLWSLFIFCGLRQFTQIRHVFMGSCTCARFVVIYRHQMRILTTQFYAEIFK